MGSHLLRTCRDTYLALKFSIMARDAWSMSFCASPRRRCERFTAWGGPKMDWGHPKKLPGDPRNSRGPLRAPLNTAKARWEYFRTKTGRPKLAGDPKTSVRAQKPFGEPQNSHTGLGLCQKHQGSPKSTQVEVVSLSGGAPQTHPRHLKKAPMAPQKLPHTPGTPPAQPPLVPKKPPKPQNPSMRP